MIFFFDKLIWKLWTFWRLNHSIHTILLKAAVYCSGFTSILGNKVIKLQNKFELLISVTICWDRVNERFSKKKKKKGKEIITKGTAWPNIFTLKTSCKWYNEVINYSISNCIGVEVGDIPCMRTWVAQNFDMWAPP